MTSSPNYLLPFAPTRFFVVPHSLLLRARTALELDALDLLLHRVAPGSEEAAFPEDRDVAWWVRSNDDGLPNLMSHVAFHAILKGWLASAPEARPFLTRSSACKECFQVSGARPLEGAARLYKPRSYMDRRWPVWFGRSGKTARAALLAFFALMVAESAGQSALPLEPVATVAQLRSRAETLLPHFDDTHSEEAGEANRPFSAMAAALKRLAALSLINEVRRSSHGPTYRLNLAGFDSQPVYDVQKLAHDCGLDLEQDRAWVDLVTAFLEANCLPQEDCRAIWRELRARAETVATPDDARSVLRLLQRRRGRGSVTVSCVVRDYRAQMSRNIRWQMGEAAILQVAPKSLSAPAIMRMPVLPTSSAHLDATQLLMTVTPEGRTTRRDITQTFSEATIEVSQGKNRFLLVEDMHLSDLDMRTFALYDCNRLHGRLDYALPFHLHLHHNPTRRRMQAGFRFRVRVSRDAGGHG